MIELNELKSKLNIAEVIRRYIDIVEESNPQDNRAVCPFHHDQNPSLSINIEKGFFNCFGCDAGGDVIKFVERIEGVSFQEAFQICMKYAGIDLEIEDLVLMDNVKQYYKKRIKQISAFTNQRSISEEMIDFFEIGFSDSNIQDFLYEFQDFTQQLIDLDLILDPSKNQKLNSRIPKFIKRIIFPIRSHFGTISMSGRDVFNISKVKYINTEDNRFFKKNKALYNLDIAAKYIKKENYVIIQEGFIDVQRSMVCDYYNSVASLGTAFTQEQAKTLKNLTNTFCFIYDGDDAGLKATSRAILNSLYVGIENINVIIMPPGEDPDSYLLKHNNFDNLHLMELNKFVSMHPELFQRDKVLNHLKTSSDLTNLSQNVLNLFAINKYLIEKKTEVNFYKNKIINYNFITDLALIVDVYPELINMFEDDDKLLINEEMIKKDVINLIQQNKNFYKKVSKEKAISLINKELGE